MNQHAVFGFSIVLGLAALSIGIGCGSDARVAEETTGSVASAYTSSVDLISPATCGGTAGNTMFDCTVSPRSLTGLPLETAVPLRTRIDVQKSGKCSTPFPLEVTFTFDGGDPVKVA